MVRPFIYLQEEEKKPAVEDVKKLQSEVIIELSEYLKTFEPETRIEQDRKKAPSKSSIMGPVGKLISSVASGRFENKDAIVGFVVSLHNNQSVSRASPISIGSLRKAVDKLDELHKITPRRYWLRTLREIDYAVFVNGYGQVVQNLSTNQNARSV